MGFGARLIAAVAVAALAAALAATASAGTITRTFVLRWPLRNGQQTAFTKAIPVGSATVKSVSVVFPGGARVDQDPEFDYIVACAHRDPAFAKLAWLQESSTLWLTIVLEMGGCHPGPTVGGHYARVTVTVTDS